MPPSDVAKLKSKLVHMLIFNLFHTLGIFGVEFALPAPERPARLVT